MWLRLNLLLLPLLLVAALLLVRQAHDSRVLFAEVERARVEGRRLAADIHRLNAEREGEATNLRVDQLAREKLHMRPITPALTLQAGGLPGRRADATGGAAAAASAPTEGEALPAAASEPQPRGETASAAASLRGERAP